VTAGDPRPIGDKAALRARLLQARARLDAAELAAAGTALRDRVLAIPEVRSARVVAAYVSVGTEPATRDLLDAWRAAGVAVILPVLLGDGDLDWSAYGGPGTLRPVGRGLLEPAGDRLGVDALGSADAIVVPALAVDLTGWRLGRGGGSYDRALARVPAGRFTAALVYDTEVLASVPVGPHDRPVRAAVTPDRVLRLL
jgi:5-formyltetrahydrofolate cyclo-ligase